MLFVGAKTCTSSNGTIFQQGAYVPQANNLCRECLCTNGRVDVYNCREKQCDQIQCPSGYWAKSIPNTCCGQTCVPITGEY